MEFDIAQAISDYGFPIIAAMGMGYFIFFIWKWVTETIDPVLGETQNRHGTYRSTAHTL